MSGSCLDRSPGVSDLKGDIRRVCVQLTSDATDAIHDCINLLLANGVVATGIVVGGIFVAADQQLCVEELAIGAGAELVDRRGVEVDKESTGNMLAAVRLSKECLEGTGVADILCVGVRAAIRTETMLKQIPVAKLLAGELSRRCRGVMSGVNGTYSSQAD